MIIYTLNDNRKLNEMLEGLIGYKSVNQQPLRKITLGRKHFKIFQQFNKVQNDGHYYFQQNVKIVCLGQNC